MKNIIVIYFLSFALLIFQESELKIFGNHRLHTTFKNSHNILVNVSQNLVELRIESLETLEDTMNEAFDQLNNWVVNIINKSINHEPAVFDSCINKMSKDITYTYDVKKLEIIEFFNSNLITMETSVLSRRKLAKALNNIYNQTMTDCASHMKNNSSTACMSLNLKSLTRYLLTRPQSNDELMKLGVRLTDEMTYSCNECLKSFQKKINVTRQMDECLKFHNDFTFNNGMTIVINESEQQSSYNSNYTYNV
ncbi:hypothetical protein HCN44_002791 [Aphidius gifuensis]|uniref:Venom protein n=1 Tax=Aphidius gifuensis TaxID=684658 RepID=A0A835CNW2_APHGI|nr:hypothetical protein HCN44_002791 [Aphidius gifuensis]